MSKETPKTHLGPFSSIPITQAGISFYIARIPGKSLLSVAYTSERTQNNKQGIQRGLRTDRLSEIGNFIKNQSQEAPPLPNAIIASLSKGSYHKDGEGLYILNKPAGEAFIIDGQHRLWAFSEEYSGSVNHDLIVTVFIELNDSAKAEIFRSINGNQRKINPSLVYDLIPMLRNTESVRFEDRRAQELVEFLNSNSESPWYNRIAMIGGSDRIISQASFIAAIKKLFKKGAIFSNDDPDFFEEKIQSQLLLKYFNAVQSKYSTEWDNKSHFLCKYIGVASLLNLLSAIIFDLRKKEIQITNEKGLCIDDPKIIEYIDRLSQYKFNASEEKAKGNTYVGESGVTNLTKLIKDIAVN